ncbi:MAG: segregation/condensation protein A [Deltaproteobacteria bacterium]|nr:segregation/condensation protein A [Deltaproteobacteria bacterium]
MTSAAPARPAGYGPFLRLPLFEGPLDLLLHLCRRQELPLARLALSQVTAQFLAYLELMEELELEVAGEFVETAALLCLLKSREMLPANPLLDDEEEEHDPRADLIRRLLDYKSFSTAASTLDLLPRRGRDWFARPAPEPVAGSEGPLDCDLIDLLSALRDLLERSRQRASVHQVAAPLLPLADRMAEVLGQLLAAGGLDLSRLLPVDADRPLIVVTFLAVLHLAHERRVRLTQVSPGAPILLEAA